MNEGNKILSLFVNVKRSPLKNKEYIIYIHFIIRTCEYSY